ncbi:class A beta-lactamase-related serine hydrolase [Pseudarthrobacter phenanthrenivorans]|uniref:Class A beta-lactamase-related serine hydrolase n=1 Tax=Pseudarthrobacter phenanthrenivorans TaxID=361575 RepID=A0A3B0G1R9_PSEPS|nr:serine hydrolase domain-containing protein [Pseudarthrobacter phenanthrenivorans]RKO26095.1 class A beta-lactamase-related serine hydrolase [Pseudarthrobacter phenanthrenivorans]
MRTASWSSRFLLACFLLACFLLALAGATTTSGSAPAPGAPNAPTETAPPEHAYAQVDSFLLDQLETLGIPGAAIAVVRDGRQVHSAAFGTASPAGRPMTPQTPVLLASTSKSLTAIAVMQQVEAGRLQLDEPVRTYLPWFRLDDPRSAAITVRHLLHQTSGMSSRDTAFEASLDQEPDALEESVRALAGSPLAGEPGRRFHYASANYNVLGVLVQTVANQPFGEYLEQHVFGPLGMGHSHPTAAAARADNAAEGYSRWFSAFWLQTDVPTPAAGMPSSTLYASAEDLGRQLAALLDGGRYGEARILQPGSVAAMFQPRISVDETKGYAMGWFTRPLVESVDHGALGPAAEDLPRLLEHQGEWGNSHTYLAMVPESGLGVALVINGNDTAAPSRLKAIDTNILRILHGHSPVPAVVQEDWLQRSSWAAALGLLLAELLSLRLSLAVLFRRPPGRFGRLAPLAWAAVALVLDAFALWLCLIHAPARFDTDLLVIIRQFPDVGVPLVPALGLAVLWSLPRTVWLVITALRRSSQGVR